MRFRLIWLLRYIWNLHKAIRFDWNCCWTNEPGVKSGAVWTIFHFIFGLVFRALRCIATEKMLWRLRCIEMPFETEQWTVASADIRMERISLSLSRCFNLYSSSSMLEIQFSTKNTNWIGLPLNAEWRENWIDSPLTYACIDCTNLWTTQNQ